MKTSAKLVMNGALRHHCHRVNGRNMAISMRGVKVAERWDIVLSIDGGPQQVARGPVVEVGSRPSVGGLAINHRAVAQKHCVLTAYDSSTAAVAPVGTHQVRLAPHSQVNWAAIECLSGPVHLSQGSVILLGPVGRGVSIEFIRCQPLGVRDHGNLQSGPADAIEVIPPTRVPQWFIGCLGLMATMASTIICLIGGYGFLVKDLPPLGPTVEGYEFYDSVTLEPDKLRPDLLEGLQRPFWDFVMSHNQQAAPQLQGLDEPENWDTRFYQYTVAAVQQHGDAWAFYRQLDRVRNEYGTAIKMVRESGLPEVFAAMPYRESRYKPKAQSEYCARGYWQFMPESAWRLHSQEGLQFEVANCHFKDQPDYLWSPSKPAPPKRGIDSAYMNETGCLITHCERDDREDLVLSTTASIFALREAFEDEFIGPSGSAVQITIASHNAGYFDGRFGKEYAKSSNLRPSYRRWLSNNANQGAKFYGANILCAKHDDAGYCGGVMPAQTQHYVYNIVARHLLAACYYGLNFSNESAFAPYAEYVGGYCADFAVPTADQVRAHKRKP
ncbi:MAG: transglycosylase SLT domain-containing protein [Proteobacteria bacterium]|nr:transglycosylase SLT domain-containing protein [Pseudomonadota bacterium]